MVEKPSQPGIVARTAGMLKSTTPSLNAEKQCESGEQAIADAVMETSGSFGEAPAQDSHNPSRASVSGDGAPSGSQPRRA